MPAAIVINDAARSVRRSPAYSLFVVFILAVGISSATVTFSVVDAVVLSPIPLDHSERLVYVPSWDLNTRRERISADGFWAIHDRASSLETVADVSMGIGERAGIDGASYDVNVVEATSDIFPLLRFRAAVGRVWNTDEDARRADVAVIGHRFSQRLGSPALGRQVTINRRTLDVIGVLGAETDIPGLQLAEGDIWTPRAPPRASPSVPWRVGMIARMRPGATTSAVADEVQRILATPDWRPNVTTFLDGSVQRIRGWMLLALGAVTLVVIIACVNAAHVILTRSVRRSQEFAIRSSLGASRGRLAMTVMSEGAILSFVAGVSSLLFATWGIAAARHAVTSLLPGMYRASSIALDGRVFAAALVAIVVTGVLASVVPAWYVSRTSVAGVLKHAGPTHTGGRSWRSALLVGEIASVSVLLVVSWMFVASFIRVVGLDLGVDSSRLLAVASNKSFKGSAYDMADRLRSVAGVEDVALVGSSSLPLVGWAYGGAWDTVTLQRNDPDTGARARVMKYRVTPNFFRVAGARFLRGSTWSAETALAAPPVVLDERAAAMLFASADPLGQRVRVADPVAVFTVVGVVPHVYTSGPEGTGDPQAYFDLPQSTGYRSLFVRTSRPAGEMAPVVTSALAPFAPDTDAPFVRRVDDAVGRLTAVRRFNTAVMLLFGAVGMIIGAIGVYGVMAATVTQQLREIGIRVALGATPGAIRRGVLQLTARHLVMGLGVGLPLGWYISRGFGGYLFQVTPADASVYAGVAALLATVGVSAALIPARRAARTDPIRTLRAS